MSLNDHFSYSLKTLNCNGSIQIEVRVLSQSPKIKVTVFMTVDRGRPCNIHCNCITLAIAATGALVYI